MTKRPTHWRGVDAASLPNGECLINWNDIGYAAAVLGAEKTMEGAVALYGFFYELAGETTDPEESAACVCYGMASLNYWAN